MSDERKKMLVRFMIGLLMRYATDGAIKLLWMDLATGRATFEIDPNNEQVAQLLLLTGSAS